MTEEIRRRGRPVKQTDLDDLMGGAGEEHPITSKAEYSALDFSDVILSSSPEIPSGWFPMTDAPLDKRIVVSLTGEDQTSVYWRMRKVVDKKNLRYIPKGGWTDHLSRLDIDFEPKYWRPYVASDYIPVPRAK